MCPNHSDSRVAAHQQSGCQCIGATTRRGGDGGTSQSVVANVAPALVQAGRSGVQVRSL
jgi:hypothetical protein